MTFHHVTKSPWAGAARIAAGLVMAHAIALAGCGGSNADPSAGTNATDAAATAPLAPAAIWYVSVDGDRRGPFEEAALRADVASGRIPAGALAWRDGLGDWRPVDQVFAGARSAGDRATADANRRLFLDICRRTQAVWDHRTAWDPIIDYLDNPGPTTQAAAGRMLAGQAKLLDDARQRWTKVAPVHIDHSSGWLLYQPHLSSTRHLAQLLSVDARISAARGDGATAAADAAALARLAQQAASDETVMSSLVSAKIVRVLSGRVLPALSSVSLEDADRARVRDATRWLENDDPFHLVRALQRQRQHLVESVRCDLQPIHERPGTDLRRFIGLSMDQLERFDLIGASYGRDAIDAVVNADDLDRETARCREAYDALLALLEANPWPAQADLDSLEQRIESGAYGAMAAALLPRTLKSVSVFAKLQPEVENALAKVP